MICPHCGERALAVGQRYCHACGAALPAHLSAALGNVVGDGRRPLDRTALVVGLLAPRPVMRLALWVVAVAVALLAVTVVAITVVGMVLATVAALAPLALFMAVLWLMMRPRRRYRRWM